MMNYYIVGGAVRDLLLGRAIRDIDAAFDGPEEEFIQRNPSACKVSDSPGPVYLLKGIEYAPLQDGNPASDMMRRDFTINALALSMDGTLHAHPRTFADLGGRLLRPASPSSLADDPVRVFRCARLAALMPDFAVHPEALSQMRGVALAGGLTSIAAEQVGRETVKACYGARPGNFLRILQQGEALSPWFAELAGAHRSSVLKHTATVMDGASMAARSGHGPDHERGRALAAWMALCHDLGKTLTPAEELPRHLGHEHRGEALARELGLRLRMPGDFIRAGALAARLHMKGGRYMHLRPNSKVDLLTTLTAAHLLTPFFHLVEADKGDPGIPRQAHKDAALVLGVTLPEEWQNRGRASGERLRALRCNALIQSPSPQAP